MTRTLTIVTTFLLFAAQGASATCFAMPPVIDSAGLPAGTP